MTDLEDRARRALGTLATNVVVVSVATRGSRHGCVANVWGEEVDPPMLACSLAEGGRTLHLVVEAGHFGVSVLAAGQAGLVSTFTAPPSVGGERFDGLASYPGKLGDPLLAGSLAGVECQVATTVPFGRQRIVVGQLISVESEGQGESGGAGGGAGGAEDLRPLLYAASRLFTLGEPLATLGWQAHG